jgi:nucleoside-diphosphate-sugar epimerase
MTKTVLILGSSGKIGRHAEEAFARAGWQVRRYDRKSNDMVAAARGVDVIVNGLNPPNYHDWERQVPAITRQVIAAAKASGATVIVPGNVYNFGAHVGELSESTPQTPNSRKGKIRVEMERAYRASGVPTVVLRAGNFIDPYHNGDVMSLLHLRSLASGKIMTAGDPNVMQAYCYLPDWARAAVGLAEMRAELARFEDVPFGGHTFSVEQLRTLLSKRLSTELRIARLPWWVLSLCSPFWELARELLEMRYLSNTSHWLSNSKLERLLPNFRATALDDVLLASLPEPMRDRVVAHAPATGKA